MNFGSPDKMKIISSEPKYYLGIPGKGLINSLGFRTIRRSKKIKKARFTIINVSLRDISRIIKEFDYLTHEGYARNCSKHMTTEN